ncbi:hypothetical protein OHC33_005241 [Knufia fluminis]|uniref:DUF803-domain-containing protein n=1 Tax=Knufia fluminis TaxID=191047 RepID=A0AAN8EET7_9EURO|nr:hypothetical protein OHC33_005241 [Knufia fluminis]
MPLLKDLDSSSLHLLYTAHNLIARNETTNGTTTETAARPPVYKVIGLSLAVASGLFIGVSFVLKKMGLLKANVKYNEEAGEGYGYLKNAYWWGGMTLMIVGEVCNFVAYAFTDAILVTPLGALSVVVTTILSAIFLKERLSFVGKVGCFNCIIGSVVIVLNAPEQSAVADIQEMQKFVIAPGFLSYAGVIILGSVFIALWVGPRYGKKSMFVYLSICSLIGGLSVVATQGLGAAVIAAVDRGNQFNQWFLYVLLVFVIATLVTEIIYLNKALNIFNAALVTPTYYVFFTSTTIITSAILFRGFHGTAVTITTVIMGFLQICSGVVLLQLSKSAKDVPDAAVFKGDLNQVREVAEQEHPESEPKADAIRGAASIIRRLSTPRQKMEQQEAKRLREEKAAEHLEPLKENEIAEWDGLRRRKTVIGSGPTASPIARRKTVHPPLGMTHFPDEHEQDTNEGGHKFLANVRERAHTILHPNQRHNNEDDDMDPAGMQSPVQPVALTSIHFKSADANSPALPYGPGSFEEAQEHIYGHAVSQKRKPIPSPRSKPLPKSPAPSSAGLQVPEGAKRQFSFSNMFRHSRQSGHSTDEPVRPPTAASHAEKKAKKNGTEEERLGLVKGDSSRPLMADSSPEQRRDPPLHLTCSDSPEAPETASLYDNYPYTQSHRYHRSAPPDTMSDDGVQSDDDSWQAPNPAYQQRPAQPFSFSSSDPSAEAEQTPQRPPSRNRPKPPAIYTPPPPIPPSQTRDFAQSSERVPQVPSSNQGTRRLIIGQPAPQAQAQPQHPSVRSPPSLDPPVQFHPTPQSGRRYTRDLSPIVGCQSQEDVTLSETNLPSSMMGRGRPMREENDSESPSRSDGSRGDGNGNAMSRERFAEQSARERAERRDRAKRRSYGAGVGSARQSMDFS